MVHQEMLIGGHFIGGPCDQSIGKLVVKNPFSGETVGTAAEGGFDEVNAAIGAAHDAQRKWRLSPLQERTDLLTRIADSVRENAEELAQLMTSEIGKPISMSRTEVFRMAVTFDLAAEKAGMISSYPLNLSGDPRSVDYDLEVVQEPLGVVFGIVPYNWPFNLAAHKIAPAIATGNSIVLKVSQKSPLCTMQLGRLIHDAGCPAGLLNIVNASAEAVDKGLEDPRVAMLSFTGSPKVGWYLKEKMNRKRVLLELGGDASAIILEDANLDWACERLVPGAFGYAGQICISVQHVRVQAKAMSDVRARLIEGAKKCPTGDPTHESTVCGPLIDSEAADRVMHWIDEAVEAGAHLLVGGTREGNVIAPTILEDVPKTVRLGCEEVFGPVMALSSFDRDDEAIEAVNESHFGIHAAVFGENEPRLNRFARDLQVGGVILNDSPSTRFDAMPYGGVKDSGFGREGIRYTMQEMLLPKAILKRKDDSF